MNRADAYAVLASELESWRQLGYKELLGFVGQAVVSKSVRVGGEEISVDVCVRWASVRKRTLRIDAVAGGPSCYRLERLDESIVVEPGDSGGR